MYDVHVFVRLNSLATRDKAEAHKAEDACIHAAGLQWSQAVMRTWNEPDGQIMRGSLVNLPLSQFQLSLVFLFSVWYFSLRWKYPMYWSHVKIIRVVVLIFLGVWGNGDIYGFLIVVPLTFSVSYANRWGARQYFTSHLRTKSICELVRFCTILSSAPLLCMKSFSFIESLQPPEGSIPVNCWSICSYFWEV